MHNPFNQLCWLHGKPNVDACEDAKYDCLQGNAVLPGIIREVCEDLKIPWGHVSSGCVYSGRRSDGKGWTEEDEPNFLSGHHHAVFTVEQKLLVKKFWMVQKTALFGDCEFLSIMSQSKELLTKTPQLRKPFGGGKLSFAP